MKRTLIPKFFALNLSLWCWVVWPNGIGLFLSVAIFFLVFLMLSLPVFHPRSSFYVPTLSAGPGGSDQIALSFDDGPDPRYTPKILDFLASEGIAAIFFVVGKRVQAHPDLAARILREGHALGGHSLSHGIHYHFSLPRALHRDFEAFDRILAEAVGIRCRLFRSPQGFRTPLLADVIRARKLICIGWSRRGLDSVRTDPKKILKSLLKNLSGGSVLVLHDGAGLGSREDREATLMTLPRLVSEIKARGLRFERLDAMLGVDAYAPIEPESAAPQASSVLVAHQSSRTAGIKNPLSQTIGHQS